MNPKAIVGKSIRVWRRARYRRDMRRFRRDHPGLAVAVMEVRRKGLTFLEDFALAGLALAVLKVQAEGLNGAIVEAGTALGGSGVILGLSKEAPRPLYLYDTFGLIPPPTEEDGADVQRRYAVIESGKSEGIAGGTYYGYRDDLIGEITSSFAEFGVDSTPPNVVFVKGTYESTMPSIDFPVALAHVDCDWYDSVKTCLEQIAPHMVEGGIFVIDDYYTWSGARTAVDEFLAHHTNFRTLNSFGRIHLVKCK